MVQHMERNLWGSLKVIFLQYRRRFVKAAVMVVIANLLLVMTPLAFRQAVAAVDAKGLPAASLAHRLLGSYATSLWAWVVVLLALSVGAACFKYFMRMTFIAISRDAERDVRSKLFDRIQEQSMAFFDSHGIGELLSRLSNDISAYRDVLGPGIMYPLFFITLVAPGMAALFYIEPKLALISLVPLLAIPVLNLTTRQRVYLLAHQVQKGLADLSAMAQEHYAGIRIVKGYAAENLLTVHFSALCQSLIGINTKLNCFQGLLFPFFNLITKLVTVVLVLFTGLIILKAWGTLSAADFVSFMWIQSYVFFPVLMLAWVLPIYQRGAAAYERLVEIYHEPIQVQNTGSAGLKITAGADIEFKQLTFAYPRAEKNTLNDFSLHIKGGSFVGITGPVGSGKTTLFRLLNREYEIPRDKLIIGGHDVHDYRLEAFWNEMVTVEQMPFLFSRTIADNVRFGNAEALQAEVEAAAAYADLHETVQSFPAQYNTLVGERGVTLSGGQKQRVAMARAFLVDRSILLLDDIFSAVDAETEMRIFMAMQANLRHKTILFISHRISVLEAMDRIIYMQAGRIVEDGTPQALKVKNGPYAAMVALQS